MHARSEKGWPFSTRRLLLIVGAMFLILAAIGAMIVYSRSVERKKISINKIDQSAFVVPKPVTGGRAIPKLGSACFNPHLDLTVSSAKVSQGAIIRLSTPGVIGGFDYGDVAYQWTASAGTLTQDGRTASLDTRAIDKNTEISVRVTATGKNGLCGAKSQDKIIQVILPYNPTIISIEPFEVIPDGLPNLRRSPSLLCLGDRLRLRAVSLNERLRFEWQSTAGEISREGREVVFNTGGIVPGVHTVMVRAGSGFDSIPIAVAACSPRGPQLADCPQQLQPEITQKPDNDGILFSVAGGGVFPYPGNYKFNWSVSAGRIYGRGGVAWFDTRSDPFAENFEVQLMITGDQPQCRLTAGTTGGVVRRLLAYRIEMLMCSFSRNSADLNAGCRSNLKELADDLKKVSGGRAYIDVYRLPGEIEGFELLRGREIRQFLIEAHRIEPARIFIRSGGISTFLSRDPETAQAELKFAAANAPVPDGPAIVFFSEDESLPELKFQEEVTGSYPNRIETGRQETVSIRFTRKLTELPLPSPTRTTQGDKTTTTQPVIPVPGRDQGVILEEAMGRDFELWIRATLGSEQFEVSPATPETTEWRRLALAGEAQWDWTISPRSDYPLQTIDASVEVEWRPKTGVTAETVRHTLWKETLTIDVDDPLFKSDQIRIATPAFSVAGLAFIVIGAWPIKKKGGLTVDTTKIEEARAPDYTRVHAPHRTVSTGAFSEPPGSGLPETVPVRAGDDESNKEQDLVECSVFAPPATVPAATIMVQVFAHLHEQAEEAERRAREFDEETRRRAVRTLASRISRGSELMFDLNISGWTISDPVQKLTWNGYPESVNFIVEVPADCKPGNFHGKVTVSRNSVPIGHISFLIRVADTAAKSEGNQPAGIDAKRYSFVFISYASADRSEVLERIQMLDAMGIKYFQDLLSLDPGDRWEKKLYQNIDKCDLFLLFWSHHAKESEWVIKEAQYALTRKGGDDDAPPEIKPVIIEGPPIVLPPPSLAPLHFNDKIIYFMSRK